MRTLYLLFITIFCLANCETKKNDKIPKNILDTLIIKKDSLLGQKKREEDINKEIPAIKISEKDSLNTKLNLLLSGEKKYITLNESKLFMAFYSTLDKLYFLNEIKKGITLQSEINIEVSELYYKDKIFAKKVFENLKKQLKDKDNESEKEDHFFDYFKRGTIYILENNKIITIIYYPSLSPKNDKTIENFLKNNKNSFNSIIRTYMMGSFETIM